VKRNIKKKQDGYGMSLIFNNLEANNKTRRKPFCFFSIICKASVDSSGDVKGLCG
jgi:hypothetical protein